MIALGSGEPTRAICSSLIAQAFQHVRYPILPRVEKVRCERLGIGRYSRQEILHIRHHSLYAPCDFDLSPYFEIVKPTLVDGFSHNGLNWGDRIDPHHSLCVPCADDEVLPDQEIQHAAQSPSRPTHAHPA